jgi:hypothetical protein
MSKKRTVTPFDIIFSSFGLLAWAGLGVWLSNFLVDKLNAAGFAPGIAYVAITVVVPLVLWPALFLAAWYAVAYVRRLLPAKPRRRAAKRKPSA